MILKNIFEEVCQKSKSVHCTPCANHTLFFLILLGGILVNSTK